MKLKLDIRPDIAALVQPEIAAGEKAVSAVMREAGTSLKSYWRAQITGAGLGVGWRTASAARPIQRRAKASAPRRWSARRRR